MKKILCLVAVFCMMASVWCCPVSAEGAFYDFYEHIDVPFDYDLNGDGVEDTFSVDHYVNYFGRFAFNINDRPFVFQTVRHGYYTSFAVVDINETDAFLDIVVIGTYKGIWAEVYRYDGATMYELSDVIQLSDERDYDLVSEYLETMSVSAGGGKLQIKFGPDVITQDSFSFIEMERPVDSEYMADGISNCYHIIIDGEAIEFDQYPVNKKDHLLVPVRAIFEKLGYGLSWDAETRTAHALSKENSMSVQIGNKTIFYTVDGVSEQYECEIAPQLISDRTMVPLRGVAESAGCRVEWNEETGTVHIFTAE